MFNPDNFKSAEKLKNNRNMHPEDTESDIGSDDYMLQKCKIIGKNIRIERKMHNLSTEELARRLDLSASYIGLLERGIRCPSLKCLFKICDIFDISIEDLIRERKLEDFIKM